MSGHEASCQYSKLEVFLDFLPRLPSLLFFLPHKQSFYPIGCALSISLWNWLFWDTLRVCQFHVWVTVISCSSTRTVTGYCFTLPSSLSLYMAARILKYNSKQASNSPTQYLRFVVGNGEEFGPHLEILRAYSQLLCSCFIPNSVIWIKWCWELNSGQLYAELVLEPLCYFSSIQFE